MTHAIVNRPLVEVMPGDSIGILMQMGDVSFVYAGKRFVTLSSLIKYIIKS